MDKLEKKYRNDSLTPEELFRLRENVNSMTDSQLEVSLRENWDSIEVKSSWEDGNHLEILKKNIDRKIISSNKKYSISGRFIRVAAAGLLLVLLSATIYLYQINLELSQQEFVICTAKGEQVSVFLPDSTIVTLNSESRLSYNLKEYNSNKRKIAFEGEGYFQVMKDASNPFVINAKDLEVTVLGTVFNLKTRAIDTWAELSLEQGCVRFLSLKTNQSAIVHPNQKAILDRKTGKVVVKDKNYISDASAWKRGELIFRNVPFREVLDEIERAYCIPIVVKNDSKIYVDDLFTGVLSRTDINEVLEVIEVSYHLKAVLKDGKITLTRVE